MLPATKPSKLPGEAATRPRTHGPLALFLFSLTPFLVRQKEPAIPAMLCTISFPHAAQPVTLTQHPHATAPTSTTHATIIPLHCPCSSCMHVVQPRPADISTPSLHPYCTKGTLFAQHVLANRRPYFCPVTPPVSGHD